MAVTDWGGANSRFLGLVSVWAARSFDQTALRPSVIKRIRQIDVKYITHITSLLLLFAMIRSVVKSFKVPGVEVVASGMSNEAALTRMIDSTPKKTWSYLTLVLDG